jgi:hypothetical protein
LGFGIGKFKKPSKLHKDKFKALQTLHEPVPPKDDDDDDGRHHHHHHHHQQQQQQQQHYNS